MQIKHKKTDHLKLLQAGLKGFETQSFFVPENIQEKLIEYIELLCKWNAIHNLTAIRNPEEMIKRHLLDSLSLIPPLLQAAKANEVKNKDLNLKHNILDVGTGAGLPGIPLALCLPEYTVVMLDSNQKKINFVEHVILSLRISNAMAVCARVESYQPQQGFTWVVSRAFASLGDFIHAAGHLCVEGGKLISMKGKVDKHELEAVFGSETGNALIQNRAKGSQSTKAVLDQILPVQVPLLDEDRTLVFVALLKNGDL